MDFPVYRRNLPHIYPIGVTFFITFRLKGSLPLGVLEKMKEDKDFKIREISQNIHLTSAQKEDEIYKEEKRFFARYDKALETYSTDNDFLRKPEVAQIVADKMKEYDNRLYDLIAFCIMSNHVHLLFDTNYYAETDMSKTMQLIKGGSGFLCNQVLNRNGSFWQKESYDHIVRNKQEEQNIINYILMNPVKAGLIDDWEKWSFTYYAW
jgi:putative transposase